MDKDKKEKLHDLHIELVKLQKEIIASDLKLLVILEGRDAAGKDGTIKQITKYLSPRETRVIALGKPTNGEEKQWYFQRYSVGLPSSGEFVIFNRSWYNRAGVEKVMGFCSDKAYKSFFKDVELFEGMLVNAGFIIMKYYLDISKNEQKERLDARKDNPLTQWKTSPIDSEALKYFDEYSKARNKMLSKTNFNFALWTIINAEHKHDAHIALISHLLHHIKYRDKDEKVLSTTNDLAYSATPEHIKTKLF